MHRSCIPNCARFYLQSQPGHLGMVGNISLHCLRSSGGTLLSGWHDMSPWHNVYMAWLGKCGETSPRDRGSATARCQPLLHSSQWLQAQTAESLKPDERRGSCGQLALWQCYIALNMYLLYSALVQKRTVFVLGLTPDSLNFRTKSGFLLGPQLTQIYSNNKVNIKWVTCWVLLGQE